MEIPVYTEKRNGMRATHIGYTVDFNPDWHIPNWVAYELTSEELVGDQPRATDFTPDPAFGNDSPTTHDYTESGFDRGHMAPAGDMKWSEQAMNESFYTSNICPQNHNLNKGDWNDLEQKVRYWARKHGRIYVVRSHCQPSTPDHWGNSRGRSRCLLQSSLMQNTWSMAGRRLRLQK